MENPDKSGTLMRRATLLSLAIGIILVVLKTVAWSFTDSLSMMSSLIDSLLDVMAAAINFVAVRYALQPPDREHRFGHGKAEDLATLAQAMFICGSGAFIIIEGAKRLFHPDPVSNSAIGAEIMLVSIALISGLLAYQRYVVRATSSPAIAADAYHYVADLLTNAGVIVALVLTTRFGWKEADPLIAILIAATIIYGAVVMGHKAFQNLMDREFTDSERAEIKRLVMTHPEALGVHDLRTRRSGIYSFIQFHLDLSENISLKRAHIISDQVEEALANAFPNTDILIHQDPQHADGRST